MNHTRSWYLTLIKVWSGVVYYDYVTVPFRSVKV